MNEEMNEEWNEIKQQADALPQHPVDHLCDRCLAMLMRDSDMDVEELCNRCRDKIMRWYRDSEALNARLLDFVNRDRVTPEFLDYMRRE